MFWDVFLILMEAATNKRLVGGDRFYAESSRKSFNISILASLSDVTYGIFRKKPPRTVRSVTVGDVTYGIFITVLPVSGISF